MVDGGNVLRCAFVTLDAGLDKAQRLQEHVLEKATKASFCVV